MTRPAQRLAPAGVVPVSGPARRLLVAELRARRGAVARLLGWSLVESLPALASGLVVGSALSRFVAGHVAAGLGVLALLPLAALVGAVATRRLFPQLAALVEPVRDAFVTALVTAAVGNDGDTAVVARLTEQVESVRNTLAALLRSIRALAFSMVAALAGLAVLAPPVALGYGLIATLTVALYAALLPGLARRYRDVLVAEEDVARRAGAAFAGVRDVVACSAEDLTVRQVGEAVDHEAALTRVLARATALRSLVVLIGGQLPLVALLVAAPWLLRHGHLTLGQAAGAVTYLTVNLEPALRGLVDVLGGLGVDLIVTLDRLGAGLAPPLSPAGGRPAPEGYALEVRGLTFAYGPQAAPVVHQLDLAIPEGGHVAIVGPSGIGKSTLANLLTGLLAPSEGAVLLGGVDIAQVREADLRRALGLIPQEAYVFAGSVRENLAYLAPGATDRPLTEAVAAFGLQPLVDRLGGLDALVGAGGSDLSQGERQLIALARTYLSAARVVILDEATSNLDPPAEARAEAAFARRDGTLVVIAHRISSARRSGTILLLDGDTALTGSHDQLLGRSPLYAELVGRWYPATVTAPSGGA